MEVIDKIRFHGKDYYLGEVYQTDTKIIIGNVSGMPLYTYAFNTNNVVIEGEFDWVEMNAFITAEQYNLIRYHMQANGRLNILNNTTGETKVFMLASIDISDVPTEEDEDLYRVYLWNSLAGEYIMEHRDEGLTYRLQLLCKCIDTSVRADITDEDDADDNFVDFDAETEE